MAPHQNRARARSVRQVPPRAGGRYLLVTFSATTRDQLTVIFDMFINYTNISHVFSHGLPETTRDETVQLVGNRSVFRGWSRDNSHSSALSICYGWLHPPTTERLLRQGKPWRGECYELKLKPLVAIQRVRLPPGKGAARQPEASLAWRAATPVVKRRQQVMKRRRKPRNRNR